MKPQAALKSTSLVLLFCTLLFTTFTIKAHEVRPAYLEILETYTEKYDVLWKIPASGENLRLGLYVDFPDTCKPTTEPRAAMVNNALSERWTVHCVDGLTGRTITIAGLQTMVTDVIVRLERLDNTTQVIRLTPASPSLTVAAAPSMLAVASTYLVLGVEHILEGVDHLLFVLALLLIVGRRWGLLFKTITAFTLAHSITLALATLGYIQVPQAPVEAVIALSITLVATEILQARAGRRGLTARTPWVVALVFGLLHGLGFAGALSEVGLPQHAIPMALLLFNIGVEVGQLVFIGIVTLSMHALTHARLALPEWTDTLPPYAIGSLGIFWVIQRVTAF